VILDDYTRFHALALATHDVDPVYPILRRLSEQLNWDADERIFAVLAHVAYYDLGSALQAVDAGRWLPGLTFGTERRNHRVPQRFEKHWMALEHQYSIHRGFARWFRSALIYDDPVGSWLNVTAELLKVWGNGRWAAYKTCEMLMEVAELPLAAPSMGHAYSSGPRQGLALVLPEATYGLTGNSAQVVDALDNISDELCKYLAAQGLTAKVEQVETTLCDFHALHEGRYYVGHDIDQMQEQLTRMPPCEMKFAAFDARHATLPDAYLGERHGRAGIDKARKRVYKDTGNIVTRGAL
jgi:hypothetical protein